MGWLQHHVGHNLVPQDRTGPSLSLHRGLSWQFSGRTINGRVNIARPVIMANLVASQQETSGERAPAPLANSAPSCSPLETVEQLLQWQPCDQDALRSSVPLVRPCSRSVGGGTLHRGSDLLGDTLQ